MAASREHTQEKMGLVSRGTLQHVPSQTYTVGDRVEEKAAAHPDKVFL